MSKQSVYFIRRIASAALLAAGALAATGASAQECEVKVGVVSPMTGGASAWGLAVKAGTEFVAGLHNEAGGLQMGARKCRVRVVAIDGQCSAAGGAAASNNLAAEGVVATMGPVCSPETTGFQPVAKRQNQVFFTSSYKADAIGTEWPQGFHLLQGPQVFGPILIRESKARFKYNSVVVIGPNDQGGTDAGRQTAKMYTEAGVKANEEYYQRGTTNFGPLAARVMNLKPDVVELAATPPADVSNLVKHLTEAGYTGIFGGLGGIGLNPVLQGAGGVEKVKGYFWLELMPVEDPGARKIRDDFPRVMKTAAPENALVYPAVFGAETLMRAISIAGTDKDGVKIADALRKTQPESRYFGKGGWRGKTQYGINQELAFPIGMGIIQDGKRVGVQRVELPSE